MISTLAPIVVAFAVFAAVQGVYLFSSWLVTSEAKRRAAVDSLGPLMEVVPSPALDVERMQLDVAA